MKIDITDLEKLFHCRFEKNNREMTIVEDTPLSNAIKDYLYDSIKGIGEDLHDVIVVLTSDTDVTAMEDTLEEFSITNIEETIEEYPEYCL